MVKKSAYFAIILVFLLASIMAAGCLGQRSEIKPVGEVDVKLYFRNSPELGAISILQFEVKPRRNASNATVNILVPDGIEVVEGNTSWKGKIPANEMVNFTLKVKPVKTGEFTIRGIIINKITEQERKMSNYTELGGGNTARLYFKIGNVEIKTDNETLNEQARINASVITNLSNKPQANIIVKLDLSNSPKVGEVSDLIFTVIPREDEHNIKISFMLPNGIQIVNGDPKWEGDLKANNIYNFSIKIKPLVENDYTLRGTIY